MHAPACLPACLPGLQGQAGRLAAEVAVWKALPAEPTSEEEWLAEERQIGQARVQKGRAGSLPSLLRCLAAVIFLAAM
jgi:hypothetical protein